LTASKPMAPSRIASSDAVATADSKKKLHRPRHLDELALAAIAHAGFQQPARMTLDSHDKGLGPSLALGGVWIL